MGPSVFGCDYKNTTSVTLDEAGEGTAQVTVHRVFAAQDDSGIDLGEVDCAQSEQGCLVAVGNLEGGTGATTSFKDNA
ncbi:neocarzinostatin apoprotein domain-containing protein [Streptomyces sp. NPDC059957]|uniref:neocarzinostatin apoprotein domain-containing protein n=1 Tax=unclassified Streptomyces TaxID=2593676 RepID=UPI00366017AF